MPDPWIGVAKALLLAILALAAGAAFLLVPKPRDGHRPTAWPVAGFLTAAALVGACIATVLGVILAGVGRFSATGVILGLGLLCAVMMRRAFQRLRAQCLARPRPAEIAVVCLALVFGAFCVAHRFDEISGSRDPGVYVASGIELSRTGDLGWTDRHVFAQEFASVRHLFTDVGHYYDSKPRWLRFPGFYVTNPARGDIQPQFLPGYSVWIALAYELGGPQATQCVNAVFAALALLAFFMALRELVPGSSLPLFAVVLLAVNPAQLWFARFPSNEVMLQASAWGALFLYARALNSDRPGPGELLGALVLLATAGLVKFAAWGLIPLAAFDASYRLSTGQLRARSGLVWIGFVGTALAVYCHARFAAYFYLYGSWCHNARSRLGISFEMLPVIFVGLTASALAAGNICSGLLEWLAGLWHIRRLRLTLVSVAALAVLGAFVYQAGLHAAGYSGMNIWSENTNLVQLSFYFSPLVLVAAVCGLAMLFYHVPARGSYLLALLLGASLIFVLRRGLDAVHPWAARRWVPLLVPLLCVGAAYPAAHLWQTRGTLSRLGAALLAVVLCVLTLMAAPQLLRLRNCHGMIPCADKLAAILHPDDLILSHPTMTIAQFGSYLKARFNMEMYVQPANKTDWVKTRFAAKEVARQRRRVLYLTDEPLTASMGNVQGISFLTTVPMAWKMLPEEPGTLTTAPVECRVDVLVYQLDIPNLPLRWWPKWTPPAVTTEPTQPPLTVGMEKGMSYYLQNFYEATDVPGGKPFRWTNGNGQIMLGQLLKFPMKPAKHRLTVRAHSGREEDGTTVTMNWYLDNETTIGVSQVGPTWADYSVELDSALLMPESFLQLSTLRPPAKGAMHAGRLGVRIESLKME
jgi:hypothetical protein